MKKLKVQKVDNYDYSLVDSKGNAFLLNMEFYNEYKPQVNDIIYLDESILEEKNLYAFDNIYDKNNANIKDILIIVSGNKEYRLQRRFG